MLPELMVDAGSYRASDGSVDQAAVQNAYNSARVPVGVASASLLAAVAAGAGVWINARNVGVAQDNLAHAKTIEDERRRQWQQEQFVSRLETSARLLGAEATATRLAGVYSIARLADEWKEGRQDCVSVLCGYIRMPLNESDEAERELRRAGLDEVFSRLRDHASPSWSECKIDLSGAVVEELREPGPLRVSQLLFDGATFKHFSFIDNVSAGFVSLTGAIFREKFRLLASFDGKAWISLIKATAYDGLHIGLWQSPEASSVA